MRLSSAGHAPSAHAIQQADRSAVQRLYEALSESSGLDVGRAGNLALEGIHIRGKGGLVPGPCRNQITPAGIEDGSIPPSAL